MEYYNQLVRPYIEFKPPSLKGKLPPKRVTQGCRPLHSITRLGLPGIHEFIGSSFRGVEEATYGLCHCGSCFGGFY